MAVDTVDFGAADDSVENSEQANIEQSDSVAPCRLAGRLC